MNILINIFSHWFRCYTLESFHETYWMFFQNNFYINLVILQTFLVFIFSHNFTHTEQWKKKKRIYLNVTISGPLQLQKQLIVLQTSHLGWCFATNSFLNDTELLHTEYSQCFMVTVKIINWSKLKHIFVFHTDVSRTVGRSLCFQGTRDSSWL